MKNVLKIIKKQTGISLNPCDHFEGIHSNNGERYFNVLLSERVSESKVFTDLERFSDKYGMIRVEPNGINRVAIFF